MTSSFGNSGRGAGLLPAVHSRLSAKPVHRSAIPFSRNVLSACWISFAARIRVKDPNPNRRALLEKFGGFGKGASSPTASVAFDVLNERVIDAQLGPISDGEHTLAIRHRENIKSKARTDLLYTIFVFDRGYTSKKMISYIEDTMHARYLFRLRSKFNSGMDALPAPDQQDGIADYVFSLYGRKVRVLKF